MKVYSNEAPEEKNKTTKPTSSETVKIEHPWARLLPFYSLEISELLACKCDKRFRASPVSLILCLLFYTLLFVTLLIFGLVIQMMSEAIHIVLIIIGFLSLIFGWAAVYLTLSFETKHSFKIDKLIAKCEAIFLIGIIKLYGLNDYYLILF